MPEVAVRELTMAEAVREALSEEMRRDPSVFIIGEDVAEAGTVWRTTALSSVDRYSRMSIG